MTRERAKELFPIIKAFAEGETIEFNDCGVWKEVDCPLWIPFYKYRIKPKSDYSSSEIQEECWNEMLKHKPFGMNYRPFKNQEECWQEMLKHQPFSWIKDNEDGHYTMVTMVDDTVIRINGNNDWFLDEITNNYTFADGTPFGIKEE